MDYYSKAVPNRQGLMPMNVSPFEGSLKQGMPTMQTMQPQTMQTMQPMQSMQPMLPMQMAPVFQGGPVLPSGLPTGPSPTPMITPTSQPSIGAQMPLVAPPGEQSPQTLQSPLYTPGFLRTQIGRRMRVEFLIGTGALVDRTGTLIGVGASYILLRMIDSDDVMLCDIYSIKFVTLIF